VIDLFFQHSTSKGVTSQIKGFTYKVIHIKPLLSGKFLSLINDCLQFPFFGEGTGSKCKILSSGPSNGTFLRETTSFDALIIIKSPQVARLQDDVITPPPKKKS